MKRQPTYFEGIRQKAKQRWDQLERDPELAGPWHQLFKQVQSPRHILSELLQNADDVGATDAVVRIENDVFIFEHNGQDFTEEHFASLCRFGYSNKRALHTIGFRGIGFKSTFSLGDQVDLVTPSLSICFNRQRFTEPKWLPNQSNSRDKTRVSVKISDPHRKREVEKNLDEWVNSPLSLLFFRNIRGMQIGEHEIRWGSLGPGPIPNSEWMALDQNIENAYLLVRSESETFPEEALEEIRQERMVGAEEIGDFPPCKVEIVLGAKGRLYVVLPTGVETALPFACNAPFIQDPARLKIKDPETSPTNRWLLKRSGQLAATAMLDWLGQSNLAIEERASAYRLLPDVDRESGSLEGVCGAIVEVSVSETIDGASVLLTEGGELTLEEQSIAIPQVLLEVWTPAQAVTLLDPKGRPPLCQHVSATDRNKLIRWGLVEEIGQEAFLAILQGQHLPKPKTWRQLLSLWAYVAPEITGYRHYVEAQCVRIIPVQGRDVLYSAQEVVRLGEKKLLQSEGDWEFLAKYLIVLNQNWLRYLADQRRADSDEKQTTVKDAVDAAYAILEEIGLDNTSDVNKVIERVAAEFFAQKEIQLEGCVQIAQIAAKLNASAGEAFRFVCKDMHLRATNAVILFDEDGKLEDLLPEAVREMQLLHPDYVSTFRSCNREEWLRWVSSGYAGLLTLMPLLKTSMTVYGRSQIEKEAKRRGLQGALNWQYVTNSFVIEDWNFEEKYWRQWDALSVQDEGLWVKVAERLFAQKDTFWIRSQEVRIAHVATTGNTRSLTYESLLPSWVMRLRTRACLPDTKGFPRKPDELLRRTPETEPLLDIEPFVDGRWDRESSRSLLDLLGVRSNPTGPDRILDCLRALAKTEKPPVQEVEKWYRRLDQLVDSCSTSDFEKIRDVFAAEKLIFSHENIWALSTAVFIATDDGDVPGASVIRASVGDLTLWRKIGVADRPTVDRAVAWLDGLSSGQVLPQDDARRVRALLAKHPLRIWEECSHWINLAGEWVPVDQLAYVLTMQSLLPWGHLHPWVKQKTADLRGLQVEATTTPPFSALPPLATVIEDRFEDNSIFPGQPAEKTWLRTLGDVLRRVILDSEDETQRVRVLAGLLAKSTWIESPNIEIVPYINGTPAGTPRQADVVWIDDIVYVDRLPKAKLARRVPEEIGKVFSRPDVKAALDYSFERDGEDVRDYLEENFKLASVEPVSASPDKGDVAEAKAPPVPQTEPKEGDASEDKSPSGAQADPPSEEDGEKLPNDYADEQQNPLGENDVKETIRRTPPPAAKPSIIERFAKLQGFKKDGDNRFYHENGGWIGRATGARFPWEYRSANGDLVRYYWPKDHCLELEPLQLDADVWGLIENQPEAYALILFGTEGVPVEITGATLRSMREEGKVTLYPASYRLVYDHDQNA